MGDSLCKKSKGLPHPLAQIASVVVWPYHVTPLFHVSFSQRFRFCNYFFSKILLSIWSHNLDGVNSENWYGFKGGGDLNIKLNTCESVLGSHFIQCTFLSVILLTVDLGLIFHREKAEASLNQAQTPTKLPIFYLQLFVDIHARRVTKKNWLLKKLLL